MEVLHQQLPNGINLHLLPMEQYKTTFVGVFIHWPLGDDVASTAIIPHVLQRGTKNHPTARELRNRLAELYGSQFGIAVLKRGENLVLQLKVQLVNDQYIPGQQPLLEDCLDILRDVLLYPLQEQGGFVKRYVRGEKKNIQSRIKALLNDKGRFAFHRCLQHLCPERGYSRYKYGTPSQVDAIEPGPLWQHYQHLLDSAAVDIYVCGRYRHNRVVEAIEERFSWPRRGMGQPVPINPLLAKEHQVVRERMDLQQGKLVMALTTDITQTSDFYPALILYNGILGGYPHSKLFQQVREKEGLAYYIGSSLDSIIGLQFISAGIDAGKFSDATTLIGKQLEDMAAGRISEQELEWTRSSLRTGLLQMYDDLGEQVALAVDGRLSGRRWTIPRLIRDIDRLDKGAVVDVARRMHLQTTYFLANGGE